MQISYLHYLCEGDTALHHVRQFTAAARGLGHAVAVHAMNLAEGTGPGTDPGLRRRLRRTLKRHLSRYLHEPKELIWNLRYVGLETKLLRAERPDVLLVRDHLLTASCVAVARRLGLPLVLEVNSPAAESRSYFDEYLHLPLIPEWLEAWKLRRADRVIVVSEALREHLAQRVGLPPESFVVVPNGADVGRFHPGVEPDPGIRRSLGTGPVIGYVGSFQKFHGPELLARLVRDVGAARPAVRFLLIGDGPQAGAVRAATGELGDRVLFPGRVPHERVPSLVASFDLAVMPETAFYTSPLKVIEWMAAGLAVVAPAYGPLREILDDGREGLLFPPGDAEALVAAVLRLVDDPRLRRALGEAAARRVRSGLTWSDNARRVIGACQEAIERGRAPGVSGRPPRSDGRSR